MCGLAGILLYPSERPASDWQAIRDCFTQTLLANEERGREASGMAIIQRDGTFELHKGPVPASELIETKTYRRMLASVGPETTCLLGHTRMPTKGSRWNNANNHPLQAGHVLGIHNGHIHNDDELFVTLNLPRAGQVDSEIIFRLLDTLSPVHLNGTYPVAAQQKARALRGRFATLSVDVRRPERLLVFKREMPLCLHYHEPWQALCFSSRYIFLRKAFGRAVITEALESGRGFYFDALHLPQNGNQPLACFDIASQTK